MILKRWRIDVPQQLELHIKKSTFNEIRSTLKRHQGSSCQWILFSEDFTQTICYGPFSKSMENMQTYIKSANRSLIYRIESVWKSPIKTIRTNCKRNSAYS